MTWKNLAGLARPGWLLIVTALCALVIATVMLADRRAERRAVDAERDRLTGIVRLTASGYQSQVDKFQLVATTLSADPDVETLLERRTAASATRLNQRLASLTAALDASVIYLMDHHGTTIASSNWDQPDSFLGQNYGFRAYFTQAMARGHWEQYALGTRSRVPGLFVARRAHSASGQDGVIVVKIRFDRLEREWARSLGLAFVTNQQGVILVTSQPIWRFETVGTLDAGEKRRLAAQVEYGNAPLRQNTLFADGAVIGSGSDYSGASRYVRAIETLPNGWSVQLLAPIGDAVVRTRWFSRLAVALALAALAGLIAAFVLRARAILANEQRANEGRISELKERLVQANKLSTLGQIAAGVGHEVNQPLTAIGLKAELAHRLIGAGQMDGAATALDEISALTMRAGAITGELRRFSRRAGLGKGPVALADVFAGTQLLLGDRIRSSATRLLLDGADFSVVGEQGRLEQVLVNLVQNALDAMGDGGEIRISASRSGEIATIRICDTGPGIPESVRGRLFQPFTTSKDDGLGLGLVICRDIVAEFGGELVCEADGSGATFVITLRVAQ